ncbi:MAG: hypothetical protein J6T08_06830, partial [Lentisphaeria bacterium]|nr:hypothetical protein [Lentisphaeria bacterium]
MFHNDSLRGDCVFGRLDYYTGVPVDFKPENMNFLTKNYEDFYRFSSFALDFSAGTYYLYRKSKNPHIEQ